MNGKIKMEQPQCKGNNALNAKKDRLVLDLKIIKPCKRYN
jgi:hypothetical protein